MYALKVSSSSVPQLAVDAPVALFVRGIASWNPILRARGGSAVYVQHGSVIVSYPK